MDLVPWTDAMLISGAEMKRGGGAESCVYVAESSYMAFCSLIIKSSLAQAQLSGGSNLGLGVSLGS